MAVTAGTVDIEEVLVSWLTGPRVTSLRSCPFTAVSGVGVKSCGRSPDLAQEMAKTQNAIATTTTPMISTFLSFRVGWNSGVVTDAHDEYPYLVWLQSET